MTAVSFPFTVIASIVRTRGLRGEVLCELLTDFPEKFAERKQLFLLPAADVADERGENAREVTLEDFWMPTGKSAGRIVLRFAGIDDADEAEKLRGMAVAIRTEQRAALDPDTWYASDLLGCEVFDSGISIGTVTDVDLATTGSTLLVVSRPEQKEVLIPLVNAYLETVDLHARRIEMLLPPGLLDVNA